MSFRRHHESLAKIYYHIPLEFRYSTKKSDHIVSPTYLMNEGASLTDVDP